MERRIIIVLFIVALCIAVLCTAVILAGGPFLARFPHVSDRGPDWYYWKLPEATTAARVSAWFLYGAHQLLVWLFVRAVLKSREEKSARPVRLTVIALLGNFLFVIFHFIQTHLFYDGLAQDVPIFTSQDSVIGMLIIILVMLTPVRGLFFGKRVPFPRRALDFIRRYHGYYIGWAIVYTFWFHLMDGDWQLVIGFLYQAVEKPAFLKCRNPGCGSFLLISPGILLCWLQTSHSYDVIR